MDTQFDLKEHSDEPGHGSTHHCRIANLAILQHTSFSYGRDHMVLKTITCPLCKKNVYYLTPKDRQLDILTDDSFNQDIS